MKVEIAHDTLAKKVYEKSSAQDKMRLKVINFIKTSYISYKDSKNKILLKKDGLNYIDLYLNEISLNAEEDKFIKKSRSAVNQKFVLVALGAVITIVILIIFWRLAVSRETEADLLREQAMNSNKDLTRTVKQLEEEKNLGKQYLDSIDNQSNVIDIQNDTIKGLMFNLAKQRDSLQELTVLLGVKNQTLEVEKKQINKEKEAIAGEKEKIAKEMITVAKLKKTAEEERAIARSAALSSLARLAYESGDEKYALRLAATSWELNHQNKQACNVLYDLHNPNVSYPQTHTANQYPKIPVIIKAQKDKYKTSELSDREIQNIFTKNNRQINSAVQSMQKVQQQQQNKLKLKLKDLQGGGK